MKSSEIEPGMVIEGVCGQVREVISIETQGGRVMVRYRQLTRGDAAGRARYSAVPQVGEVRRMVMSSFAFWGWREIAEVPAVPQAEPKAARKAPAPPVDTPGPRTPALNTENKSQEAA